MAAALAALTVLAAAAVAAGGNPTTAAAQSSRSLVEATTGSSTGPSATAGSLTQQDGSSSSPASSSADSQSTGSPSSIGPSTSAASTASAPISVSSSTAVTVSSAAISSADVSTTPSPAPVQVTFVPPTPPAAAQTSIGRGTVMIAVAVLLLAFAGVVLAVVRTRDRRRVAPGGAEPSPPDRTATPLSPSTTAPRGSPGPAPEAAPWSSPIDGSSLRELMAMLVMLGDAMVDSNDPVTHVRDSLEKVARANGLVAAEIIVLPTALIITLPGLDEARTEVASTGGTRLRLDQVEAVFTVAEAAESGGMGPREAAAALQAARDQPAAFGPAVIVAGHAVIAVGLAVILAGGWTEVGVAAVLGAGVGAIKQWAVRRRLAIQVLLPVACAFLVAAAVAVLGRFDIDTATLPPILGALVTFIPGGLLTTAVIELATGQMISGASRFVYGGLQLVLLSLGIVGGLQLVGIPAVTVTDADATLAGAIAPWIGVLVFGVGVMLSYSARPDSLGWMLLVLYVAFAGQVLGGLLFGTSLSAFVGAAVMTPVAVFVATRPTGPPTMVTFLPAFWLLVPGAIALVGVAQVMSEARFDGMSSILGAGVTIVSIALGVVLGLSVGDWVTRIAGRPSGRRTQ